MFILYHLLGQFRPVLRRQIRPIRRQDSLQSYYNLYYYYVYHFSANTPPGRPINVTLLADGRNIVVRWDPAYVANDDLRHYIVTWAILPDFTDLSSGIVLDGNATIAFITVNEDVGRVFRVRVRAENVYGIGEYSLPRYVRIGKIFNDHFIFVYCKLIEN